VSVDRGFCQEKEPEKLAFFEGMPYNKAHFRETEENHGSSL